MIDAVIARLSAEVSELAGLTYGAADLADLTRRNAMPQHTPAAHVIPLGLVGQAADAAAAVPINEFHQGIYNKTIAHDDEIHAAIIDNPDLDALSWIRARVHLPG